MESTWNAHDTPSGWYHLPHPLDPYPSAPWDPLDPWMGNWPPHHQIWRSQQIQIGTKLIKLPNVFEYDQICSNHAVKTSKKTRDLLSDLFFDVSDLVRGTVCCSHTRGQGQQKWWKLQLGSYGWFVVCDWNLSKHIKIPYLQKSVTKTALFDLWIRTSFGWELEAPKKTELFRLLVHFYSLPCFGLVDSIGYSSGLRHNH